MSRTDAHSPFRVRAARREFTVVAVHRCAGRDCDLPGRSTGRVDRCYWQFTFTGVNICNCWMCHWHHRTEEGRSAVRRRLRNEVRGWNGGDREV